MAAVYGPRQASFHKEDPEKAVIQVVFKARHHSQGAMQFEILDVTT
jgi:hypothetical protein